MPPMKEGTLRLYSMVYCPYAQRARLVLAAKGIPYETVNIRLKKKPEWYVKLNPMGQVPCLHYSDGRVLPESLIVCDYLDDIYPDTRLRPTDPFTVAANRVFIEQFAKVITNYYKIVMGDNEEDKENFFKALDTIESKLKHDYVNGKSGRKKKQVIQTN